jgi:hypothetical protein
MKKFNLIALALEAAGILVGTFAGARIDLSLGGFILAVGLVLFGLALEKAD